MKATPVIIVLIIVCALLDQSTCKLTRFYFEKTALSKNWYFIDTFAFDNKGSDAKGKVFWKINNKDADLLVNVTLNLYMDTGWNELQQAFYKSKNGLSCEQVVSGNYTAHRLDLQTHLNYAITINQHTRPRFWYVVLGACDRDGSQFKSSGRRDFIELDFQWQNPGGFFRRQFSKDRQGIMAVLLVFTPILYILCIAYSFSVIMLIRSRCFHWIIRVFYGSLLIYTLSTTLNLIHNLKYGRDGVGVPFFDVLGTGLRLVAELSFLMLMYLIASGWTVTQPYLRHMKQIIAIFVTFVILYITMFAWSQISLAVQITTSDYVYETVPGIMIGVLRIPALGFFLYALRTTYKKEVSETKIWFYRFFGVLYTLWFTFLPILILTQFWIQRWNRPKWIEGISRSVELISYTVMFVMLWYSRARKYFAISEDEQQRGMFEEL